MGPVLSIVPLATPKNEEVFGLGGGEEARGPKNPGNGSQILSARPGGDQPEGSDPEPQIQDQRGRDRSGGMSERYSQPGKRKLSHTPISWKLVFGCSRQ